MAVFSTDILIKSMLEAAILDLRANPWILDDVFSGLACDPLASTDYGQKEVQSAKDWFLTQDIPVLLQWRVSDDPPIPCISVAYTGGSELTDRTLLADYGKEEDFAPQDSVIGTLKVYPKVTPSSYDPITGFVTLPDGLTTAQIAIGQFFVSSVSGNSYEIRRIEGDTIFSIDPETYDDFTDAYIAPASHFWNLDREQSFLREAYSIGIHCQNNPGQTIWLWQIITYALFRYKEAYLEGRGFTLSTVSFSPLERNENFKAQNIYSKYIEVSGQIEVSWIKYIAPKLAKVNGEVIIADGPATPDGMLNDQGWEMEGDLTPVTHKHKRGRKK
jgi:hypothetical protein